jgi:cardiolipin synthase
MSEIITAILLDFEGLTLYGTLLALLELLAIFSAVHAVMHARSGPAAIAWSLVVILEPLLGLPLYWIFGRRKFHGYVEARRQKRSAMQPVAERLKAAITKDLRAPMNPEGGPARAMAALAALPFTRRNDIELLIDGEATFAAIFDAMERAEAYILVQFFIIKNDDIGQELKRRLLAKAAAGVRVYVLYDEIGSHSLPRRFSLELKAAGIRVSPFRTTRGRANRFQINFRNHRKIVVVDGKEAFIGGHNVGDAYLGRSKRFGHWRDTHVRVTGPAVQCLQLSFLEDWHWAQKEVPEFTWEPTPAKAADKTLLVLPTGPADSLETCSLFFMQAITMAQHRIWIASPYFVPSDEVLAALQLAAIRGVDVRIMIPSRIDHLLVYLAGFTYGPDKDGAPLRIFRYREGFLHNKVMLIDDNAAAVGSANLDNRSFRLNFEIIVLAFDKDFAGQVEAMLKVDFANCKEVAPGSFNERPFWFRLAARVARLFSPVL